MNSTKIVISIDVGLLHLGLSVFEIDADYRLLEVVWVDMVDITQYTHRHIHSQHCELYHTKTMSDWVDHFVQENSIFFSAADVILIERQPHGAFVAVEQLLFSKFRRRNVVLVSPRSVHSFLSMSSADYNQRKRISCTIAARILPDRFLDQLVCYPRSHDIADSVCQFLFWRHRAEQEHRRQQREERWRQSLLEDFSKRNVFEKLEQFRFV